MQSIKKEVTKGVFWIAIAKYSGIVIQIIITAILARLLSPAAFGTIAVAMVVLYFLNIIADIGIGPAVIQYKQLTNQHLDSLFTINIYIGLFLALLLYSASGMISSFYADDTLKRVCQMMALVVFFNSINVVPNALMRKDKRFRTIALRTVSFHILSGSIAIWGAYQGWGVYALLVSPIITSFGVFIVNFYNYPLRFVFRLSHEAIRIVASFSFFQFTFSFINYFSRNLDKLIVGKFFSMTQLGYYDKSYHLMLLPVQNISFVIEPVLHPVLSSLCNNLQELGVKNQKLTVIISTISFPIGLILFFCGGEIIHIIYGPQWGAATPIFRILALSLPLQMILSTSGAIYQASGKTNHMFINGIINTFFTVVSFLLAACLWRNLQAMAWAWVISLALNFVISYLIMYRFTFHCSSVFFFKSLLPQIINSVLVFVFIFPFYSFFLGLNVFTSLFCKVFIISLLSLILGHLFHQYNFFRLTFLRNIRVK